MACQPRLCLLQGTVTKVDQKQGRHRIQYDDGLREWLPLHRHRFRWLAPRGRSSGYKASCKVKPCQPALGLVCCLRREP